MQTDTKAGAKGGVREFSRKRRLMNQAGSIVMNPYNIMVVISVIFMVYLILIPLGQMIIQTLTLAGADAARVDGGREGMFTLYYWKRVLTSSISRKMLWTPLKNSLLISVCTAAFGITLGSLLAWLMVRSDLPYKKFFSLALIIPYMIPSWCKSMAWLTIFKNERVGGAQGLLGFLGIQTPDWLAYGPFAIIVVLVIHYYAYAYLLVSSALSSISSELEEMGEILGASKARILTKITFPLVMPAILSAVIMTFSKAMGTFGVPSVLGLKIGYYTVSTTMYNSIQNGQNRVAFAISLILIAIASFSVFLNQKAIGSRKSRQQMIHCSPHTLRIFGKAAACPQKMAQFCHFVRPGSSYGTSGIPPEKPEIFTQRSTTKKPALPFQRFQYLVVQSKQRKGLSHRSQGQAFDRHAPDLRRQRAKTVPIGNVFRTQCLALLRWGAQYEISCQHSPEQQVGVWDIFRQSFQLRGNQGHPPQSPVGKHCLYRPRVLAVGLCALGGGNQHLKGIGFLLRCVQNTTQ